MCPLVSNGKQAVLKYLVGQAETLKVTHLSLHSATPNGSGSNEVSGGGYARVAVASGEWTFDGDDLDLNTDKDFSTPASQAVAAIGLWSALTGGTFLGYGAPTGDAAANAGGEYTAKAGSTIRLTDS